MYKNWKEISSLSLNELELRLQENQKEHFQIKMKHQLGQLETPADLWKLRKEKTRILTSISLMKNAKEMIS